MKYIIGAVLFVAGIFGGYSYLSQSDGVGGGLGTIEQLGLWFFDGTNITQNTDGTPIKLTGYESAGDCLVTDSNGVVSTSACGGGGGSSKWELVNGSLQPLATYATNTVMAATFTATSTTATSTFAGAVGIGTTTPSSALSVTGNGLFTGTLTALNLSGTNTGDQTTITGNAGSATYASAVTLTADNTTNATNYPLFVNAATGNLSPRTDTGFTYNPSTGLLTSTAFSGSGASLTGTASGLTAGTVTTNANLTGMITSVGNAASLGSFTSANLATALTNETGSGVAVFGTSPAFTTSITTGSVSFTAFAGATTLLTIGGTGASASLFMPSTLDTTSPTTGAIRTSGGISAAKALNIGTTGTFGTSIVTPAITTASGALTVTPAAGSNFNLSLSTTGDFAVNTKQLYVDTSAGSVGIGTTTPSSALVVQGTASTTILQIVNSIGTRLMSILDNTITALGIWNFSLANLFLPNGSAPVVDAIGSIALDTTDNQLLVATSTDANSPAVIPTTQSIGSFLISSTSQPFTAGFTSGVSIPFKIQRDGYKVTEIYCDVDGGTSVVINFDNGSGNTSTLTCTTSGASLVGVGANAIVTAGSVSTAVETGTVTGSPNYLRVSVFGVFTRE